MKTGLHTQLSSVHCSVHCISLLASIGNTASTQGTFQSTNENVVSVMQFAFQWGRKLQCKVQASLHTHLRILKLRFQTSRIFGKLDAFLLCFFQETWDIIQLVLKRKESKGNGVWLTTAMPASHRELGLQNVKPQQIPDVARQQQKPVQRYSKLKILKFS